MVGSAGDIRTGGEVVESFAEFGVTAFTTGRRVGSFGTQSDEPVREVMGAWAALRAQLGGSAVASPPRRRCTAARSWSTAPGGKGGCAATLPTGTCPLERGTAMAVTVADCVPVFIAHPSGAVAVLHSGWRGTAARITAARSALFESLGSSGSRSARALRPCHLRALLRGERGGLRAAHGYRSRQADHDRPAGDDRASTRERSASVTLRSARSARSATTIGSTRTVPATPAASSALRSRRAERRRLEPRGAQKLQIGCPTWGIGPEAEQIGIRHPFPLAASDERL